MVQPPLEPQSTSLPQSMPVSGRRQQPVVPVMPVVPVASGSAAPIFGGYDPKTGRRTMPSRPVAERGQSVAAPSSRSAVAVPARTGAQTRTGAQGATSGGTIPVPPRTTPAPAPKLTAMLYFENGTAHELSIPGQAVLGRRPSSSDPSAMLVPVPDTTGTISRSHALLEISAGRLWITDLNSTNGTEIMEDGELLRLQPKQRREIPFGTRIMLGSTAVSVNLLRNRDRGAHNGRGRQ